VANPLVNEDALARRVAYERERRGWSPGGLARLMTKAGCPMNQSSIWKIENGEPRRKITVDEAIAFAKVFETTLEELLTPPDLIAQTAAAERALRLLGHYGERFEAAAIALARCDETAAELEEVLADHPEFRDHLLERLNEVKVIPAPHGSIYPAPSRFRLKDETEEARAAQRWWLAFDPEISDTKLGGKEST
jgi:transcriptional regulator with XRE-family HTH domain